MTQDESRLISITQDDSRITQDYPADYSWMTQDDSWMTQEDSG